MRERRRDRAGRVRVLGRKNSRLRTQHKDLVQLA
jgi:hypothetical protein